MWVGLGVRGSGGLVCRVGGWGSGGLVCRVGGWGSGGLVCRVGGWGSGGGGSVNSWDLPYLVANTYG